MGWFGLARKGLWVEGCGDGFGFEVVDAIAHEPLLRLFEAGKNWKILTHEGAGEGWEQHEVIPTYRVENQYPSEARVELAQARNIWWSSGSQFESLRGDAQAGAVHACGAGKTARKLKQAGLTPVIFPSVEEWRKWITTSAQTAR